VDIMAINNKSECRKLNEHEKDLLKLCIELATQSYMPLRSALIMNTFSVLLVMATFITLYSTLLQIMNQLPSQGILIYIPPLLLIAIIILLFLARGSITKFFEERTNLSIIKNILIQSCLEKFNKENLCKEDM